MPLSFISNTEIKDSETVTGQDIREDIFNLIKSEFPGFSPESTISLNELNKYRRLYLAKLVQQERGELAMLDLDVMLAIKNNAILSENIEPEIEAKLTYGQKLADNIAEFGGSWSFIMIFFSFLLLWIAMNVWVLTAKPFDPYPFILLNLILSCLAAIQAPVIMMSQNRQEQKDRQRAEHDYKINLKAELEIKLLSEKIDHLLVHQNKKLLEIQEMQIDYLEDLLKKIDNKQG
ncbi:DUF1003 domain-containing protein [Sphingobacteriales bacterium UPWRP_1]|nr:hypothetical protein B6N25_12940 [Sphingobacteriales bacterium TSM_CSS]PSJ75267.1 DUF1003 domain-containing protein [Sphingobacteriales bacterium UPWRP_1]